MLLCSILNSTQCLFEKNVHFLVLLINCHLSITWLFSPIFIHWGLSALVPGCGFHFVEDPGEIVHCFLQFVYMIAFVHEFIVFPHILSLSMLSMEKYLRKKNWRSIYVLLFTNLELNRTFSRNHISVQNIYEFVP